MILITNMLFLVRRRVQGKVFQMIVVLLHSHTLLLLVDVMLNPLRKKRIRVDAMPLGWQTLSIML
jgi:hypothetical protein